MALNEPIKFDLDEINRAVIRKFPLIGDNATEINYVEANVRTASTDGKTIYYNPKFMDSLTYEQQIFVIAHERLHIAFNHIDRLKRDKKNKKVWNIATDAVINQALKHENLPIKNGLVNIPEAFNQAADIMYDKLMEEYKKQKNQKKQNEQEKKTPQNDGGNSQNQGGDSGSSSENESSEMGDNGNSGDQSGENSENEDSKGSSSNGSNNNNEKEDEGQNDEGEAEEQSISDWADQFGDTFDDHDIWDNSMSDEAGDSNEEEDENNKASGNSGEEDKTEETDTDTDTKENPNPKEETEPKEQSEDESVKDGEELEKNFSAKNDQKKQDMKKEIMDKINEQKSRNGGMGEGNQTVQFGDVGDAESFFNWEKVLRNAFTSDYFLHWTNRRACKDNGWSSRIYSDYMYRKPRIEIVLDTSGSVDEDLLKAFLRQIKRMAINNSQLFVGCYSNNFYGFTEIKSKKDIDNFVFKGRGGTNHDAAAHAFTNDNNIYKIVFTDGDSGTMPTDDTKKIKKFYWISFENKNFKPCCGQVLFADPKKIIKDDKDRQNLEM